MIIYKNTFENVKTLNIGFPIEDQHYALNDEAIVADGITRDPIGIKDLNSASFDEMLKKYPRPSGGEMAARLICDTFSSSHGDILDRFISCNEAVKKLNEEYIPICDYLENDYYGAVAACVSIKNSKLKYAFICDCGIIIYTKEGKIKFQTEDEKELYCDPYIDTNGIPWNIPEARKIVRREYRNNLNKLIENRCVSYGAFTGEKEALKFIRFGVIDIENDDIIVVYSDGLSNFLHLSEFIKLVIDFDKNKFEEYIKNKSLTDYEKYGKEKTLVIMKN